MHFPMTTPSFHATLETEMAFLVSQRLHVGTNEAFESGIGRARPCWGRLAEALAGIQ